MDTSEEYIKVIIVHPTAHFSFLLYICICIYLLLLICKESKIKSKLGTKLYL